MKDPLKLCVIMMIINNISWGVEGALEYIVPILRERG